MENGFQKYIGQKREIQEVHPQPTRKVRQEKMWKLTRKWLSFEHLHVLTAEDICQEVQTQPVETPDEQTSPICLCPVADMAVWYPAHTPTAGCASSAVPGLTAYSALNPSLPSESNTRLPRGCLSSLILREVPTDKRAQGKKHLHTDPGGSHTNACSAVHQGSPDSESSAYIDGGSAMDAAGLGHWGTSRMMNGWDEPERSSQALKTKCDTASGLSSEWEDQPQLGPP